MTNGSFLVWTKIFITYSPINPKKSNLPLIIGGGDTNDFKGKIDNIKIFFDALPEEHILELHKHCECESKIEGFQNVLTDNFYKL